MFGMVLLLRDLVLKLLVELGRLGNLVGGYDCPHHRLLGARNARYSVPLCLMMYFWLG